LDRKQFLITLGAGAAAIACGSCLTGCNTQDMIANPPQNVDFTLDLSSPTYSALAQPGGSVHVSGLVVAHTTTGTYVALSQVCTHQGGTVEFDSSHNRFQCPVHGSIFALDGTVVQGPASSPLAKYQTSLSGTSLHVYS
jgi:cytochrome b6-f complex iron-sulfur subunit